MVECKASFALHTLYNFSKSKWYNHSIFKEGVSIVNKKSVSSKLLLVILVGALNFATLTQAQELENLKRFSSSLPIFVSFAEVKAQNGVLTIGVFSDKSPTIDNKTLEIFKHLKSWDAKAVTEITQHKKIEPENRKP